MRLGWPDRRVCRAVIAVAALYALALQAVLGGATEARAIDPAPILCLQHADAGGDAPEKAPQHRDHLACCTAAQAAPAAAAALPAAIALAWPVREVERPVAHPEAAAPARPPPGVGAAPRAPPTA